MKLTKIAIQMTALLLVVAMLTPSLMAAEYVNKTINLSIESKYQSEHDEVVNVASESSIKNPDTWTPAPQGIWIGASTEESLFEFNVVATPYNLMKVASVVQFNRSQIMNGASEIVVRSPIFARDLTFLQLRILKFNGEPSFNINYNLLMPDYTNAVEMAVIDIDLTDTSIIGGSDAWTINDRTYVIVRCPIYSGINYAFIWNAKLATDASFRIYVSGQDICNDNIMDTRIYYVTRPVADYYVEFNTTLQIDPGISFDLITGLGNGVFANSFYMKMGDSIEFLATPKSPFSGYQTIMVPFGTSNGNLKANITVFRDSLLGLDYLWSENRTWTEYILACSSSNLSGVVAPDIRIVITVWEDIRVNWVFCDAPASSTINYYYNQANLNLSGILHTVFSRVWFSYQESVAEIFPPSMNPADFPKYMLPQNNQKATWYGTIIGAILLVAGGAMIATGVLAPVGYIVAGAGALMIIADVAKSGHLIGEGTLPGWMENALDKIRDALTAVGKFVISIGEGLWDAITWLADQIVEFGAYLLGMVLIATALYIFFYFTQFQLRVWGYAWALAEGDLRGAGREANGIMSDVALRVAGKVNKGVRVADRIYSRWRADREDGGDK